MAGIGGARKRGVIADPLQPACQRGALPAPRQAQRRLRPIRSRAASWRRSKNAYDSLRIE
jgi:hypothetical protein